MRAVDTPMVRPPGRPRSAQAHAAILDAALHLLIDRGYAGTSIEAVAAAAGVSKATIYRRWASKEELTFDVIAEIAREWAVADTGDPRADATTMLMQMGRLLRTSRAGRLLPRLLSEAKGNPELTERWRKCIVEPRRASFRELLERGIAAGQLGADLDLQATVDLLIGPVLYRHIVTGSPTDDPSFLATIVSAVWDGLAPR